MRTLRGLVGTVVGLLVDDGQLAVGVIAAMVLGGLWAALTPEGLRDLGGPFLFVVLMALLLVNLQRAARNARRASKG